MPEREFVVKCSYCEFKFTGLLKWSGRGIKQIADINSPAVQDMFSHHLEFSIGGGHETADLFACEGGAVLGYLIVMREETGTRRIKKVDISVFPGWKNT
jgi:hypothetical protein